MPFLLLLPMRIYFFFHTDLGMYLVQSFLHALVGTIISGAAIESWKIESPIVRQRFRLGVILLALISFPLYQAIDPDRGSLYFRTGALFDSLRWLEMEPAGRFSLGLLLIMLFSLTAVIFLIQEMLPILRHFSMDPVNAQSAFIQPSPGSPVSRALKPLQAMLPDVFIMHDDDLILFSTTRKKPAIYISAGLAKKLTADELRSAVAHEIAHIRRSRFSLVFGGFILRTLLFFNPVVLVEFRRAIRNEEKICDDIAVSLTGRPDALARALKKFYLPGPETPALDDAGKQGFRGRALEEHSHALHLETRISRLEQPYGEEHRIRWFPFIIAFFIISVMNYFIV